MANFALILPRPEMVAQAGRIARQLGMKVVLNQYAVTEQILDVAADARKLGADIVVARGLHASILREKTDFPIAEIRLTGLEIARLLHRARSLVPHVAITTDVIVGFPGETEEDFDKLLDFVEETRFARLGVFAYSQEENTEAGEMENQIDEDIKQERLDAIMRRQLDISLEYNREKVGKELDVLVEEKDEDGSYIGRTQYDAPEIDNSVIFMSGRDLRPGEIVRVLVEDAFDYDLVGREV